LKSPTVPSYHTDLENFERGIPFSPINFFNSTKRNFSAENDDDTRFKTVYIKNQNDQNKTDGIQMRATMPNRDNSIRLSEMQVVFVFLLLLFNQLSIGYFNTHFMIVL
jgi:hypothetical protein